MLAEIVAIGRELLTGKTLDTNSNWIAQQLASLGLRVKRIVIVDDVVEEISKEILTSIKYGVMLVITTGGLGPTFDDKTLEAVSVATGRKLTLNRDALKMVEEAYKRFYEKGWVSSPEITPERKKMAYLPDGAVPIPNPVGAAPGCYLKLGPHAVVSLPGVPKEMKAMFSQYVLPKVEEFVKRLPGLKVVREKTINSGVGDESVIAKVTKEIRERYPQVYVKSLPDTFGEGIDIPVRFTVEAEDEREAEGLLNEAIEEFKKALDKWKS